MYPVQRLAIDGIYCSPSQDRQFNFTLIRVSKADFPTQGSVNIYGTKKNLPDRLKKYHVFTLGNIPSHLVNLLSRKNNWILNKWYNVSDDMTEREYILQIYTTDGIMFPGAKTWYSRTEEGGLIFALEADEIMLSRYDIAAMKYVRFYTNNYLSSVEYNTANYPHPSGATGITSQLYEVTNNSQKVIVQMRIINLQNRGGSVFAYSNGMFVSLVNLNLPDNSHIEIIHDHTVIARKTYPISSLRTFMSEKDPGRLKYLIPNDFIVDDILFDDDIDVYVVSRTGPNLPGLYFYSHKAHSIRNVTNKDFALDSEYINNTAQKLSDKIGGSVQDKAILIYYRRSTAARKMMYNSSKTHELYKLPKPAQIDVMNNTGYTISEFRAENLENSDYFKVVNASKLSDITNVMAYNAMGYSSVLNYLGKPVSFKETYRQEVDIPLLYRGKSTAYEYGQGCPTILKAVLPCEGPIHPIVNTDIGMVEFIYGRTPAVFERLYNPTETITLRTGIEYRLLSAMYDGVNRLTIWEDITDNDLVMTKTDTTIVLNEVASKKVKIVYMDQPYIRDYTVKRSDGVFQIVLKVNEDRGDGVHEYTMDTMYSTVEVFLNGHRLDEGIDYNMNYPFISICAKTQVNFDLDEQSVHVRAYGMAVTDKADINARDVVGFIKNGKIGLNGKYDVTDDRNFKVFMGGSLIEKGFFPLADEDGSIEVDNTWNGSPYTMVDSFVSLKELTGLNTVEMYRKDVVFNEKLSALYDIIRPEPVRPPFNVIQATRYMFSPTLSLIIKRLLDLSIPASLYTNPYNDFTILSLLDTYPYKELLEVDPIKKNLPANIVTIHPSLLPPGIEVNLHMYRFLTNVVRILTAGTDTEVNLSTYLTVTTEDVVVNTDNQYGGIIIV